MVDLNEKKIILRGQEGLIAGFETWWLTPFGFIADLDEALAKVNGEAVMIKPVTIAMCSNGLYEAML